MKIRNDISGQKFNKLLVIEPVKRKKSERTKYRCQCDCGNETIVDGSKIKNNHTKSCGCLYKEVDYGFNKLNPGEANRNSLIYNYKHNAKVKGINFKISDEEMIELFESNCHYCGDKPNNVINKKNSNGEYRFNGIDRKDNDKNLGYITENVVSCCSRCNFLKNKMNYYEFLEWIKVVYEKLLL